MKKAPQQPSIESLLARDRSVKSYPIAKRLESMPFLGDLAHRWVRSTQNGAAQNLWASLPPVAPA